MSERRDWMATVAGYGLTLVVGVLVAVLDGTPGFWEWLVS